MQGNYSGLDKRDEENIKKMIITYNELSKTLIDQDPDLIVWPETAIPDMLTHIIQIPIINTIPFFIYFSPLLLLNSLEFTHT